MNLTIFKKAKRLIDKEAIELSYIKGDKIAFEVLDKDERHYVTLTFQKIGTGKEVYRKIFSCTCKASSMRGMLHQAECSHSLACLVYFIENIKEF